MKTQKKHNFPNFFDFSQQITPILKKDISAHLKKLISSLTESKNWRSIWKLHMQKMLQEFLTSGKMLRSTMLLYWMKIYGIHHITPYLSLGTAMEFLQSYLLIHDDVMDNDDIRRQQPTIHIQCKNILSQHVSPHSQNATDMQKGGESLAICIGDTLFSYAFQILASFQYIPNILLTSTHYINLVSAGQMNDVYWTHIDNKRALPSSSDILDMYEHKTGTYTFILPFTLGMLSAHHQRNVSQNAQSLFSIEKESKILKALGNTLGKMFQIQDDIIGTRYDSHITGKTQKSDLIEKKHTYVWQLFIERIAGTELHTKVMKLRQSTDPDSVTEILHIMDKIQLWKTLQIYLQNQLKKSERLIQDLHIPNDYKPYVTQLAEYTISRHA